MKQGQQLGEMSQEGKFGTSGNQNTSSSEIFFEWIRTGAVAEFQELFSVSEI